MKRSVIFLVLVILLTACSVKQQAKTNNNKESSESKQAREAVPKKTLKLFFPNESADGYKLKEQIIAATPENVLAELMKESSNLFPKGTKVIKIGVKGGLATVDFNDKVLNNPGVGAEGEEVFVYSIVDSLCQLEDIKRVNFMVSGEPIGELWGHVDLSKPLKSRN